MPAMLVFLSHWFTKAERSRANTFLILGNPATVLWMSIVSGYILESLGWRWMFILEGLPAVIWAFLWWKLVNDHPKDVKWLSEEEKSALNKAMIEEQKELEPVKDYKEAFKSRTVILLSLQYFLWSIGVYGFVMWLPTIINSAPNASIVTTGWLASIPYVLACVLMLTVSHFSDKYQNRTLFVYPFLLIGAICFYGSYLIGTSNFWLSFTLLAIAGGAMYAPYGPFFAIIPEILPRNVSGGAMALINSMGALGSFAGAYIVGFLNDLTGGFGTSYNFMAISLLLSAILTIIATKKKKDTTLKNTRLSEVPLQD